MLFSADPELAPKTGSTNAAILGMILLVVTTVTNAIGVEIMAIINSFGVTCELVGVVLLIIALTSHAKRGPGIVLNIWRSRHPRLFRGAARLGPDGRLCPRRLRQRGGTVRGDQGCPGHRPRTIIRAVTVSGFFGALLLLAALMATPQTHVLEAKGKLSDTSTGGLAYIVTSRLGDVLGRFFIADVALSVQLAKVSPRTRTQPSRRIHARAGLTSRLERGWPAP